MDIAGIVRRCNIAICILCRLFASSGFAVMLSDVFAISDLYPVSYFVLVN